MLGESQATRSLRERAARAAATNVTVLLQGETGSGKEVVAQFIHQNSPRKDGPYIKVNCAAIPDTLIESELFGHVKGAFTDARRDRKGKFAQADHGTLLLDEIGEMPLVVQAKVLRAIENKEIEPVGSEAVVSVDVRIIAATNRDLAEMAKAKQFREDLYHRLNVVPVPVPPLRDRLEDIELLAPFFLDQFCAENGLAEMSFAPDALAQLRRHSWPGNVRELRNVVQRCAASAEGVLITAKTIESHLQL
jgi:two-component system response regulator HydG